MTIVDVRTLLRYLGNRYGIGAGLLVFVAVVLVAGRVLPHTAPPSSVTVGVGASVPPQIVSAPAVVATPSVPLLQSPVPPRTSAGKPTPQSIAQSFAVAWLHSTGVSAAKWLHGVMPYSTPELVTQLRVTDPANVPASRITKDLTVVNDTSEQCIVDVPMDTGTLALTMTSVHGRWLVDDVDWTKS